MTRYTPSRIYWIAGGAGYLLAAITAWLGLAWTPAFVAAVLFLGSSTLLALLSMRPPIEVRRDRLVIGDEMLAWDEIRAIERTGWDAPLIVRLHLADGSRKLLVFPGDPAACKQLLRQLQKFSRRAAAGHAGRLFSGRSSSQPEVEMPSARYPLLREEDEAEVERLYQRLKSVGHIDPKSPADEN